MRTRRAHEDAQGGPPRARTTGRLIDRFGHRPTGASEPDAALEERCHRLAEAQRLAHVGSWSVDLVTGKRAWSDELYRLLGYEPGEVEPSLDRVLGRLLPADAESVWPRFLARMAHPDGWVGELQIVLPGGAVRCVAARTEPVLGKGGDVVGIQGTAQDVTDWRRAHEEASAALAEARDQALAASRLKAHFLANMSHEIRTPMNGVLGMTELLLDTPLDVHQRECALAVQGCGDDLLAILNDILDLSEIDAGQFQIECADFDVAALIEDVAELFAGRAHAKGVELVISVGDDVPALVHGDPGRVRQVISNLVANAVKFTPAGLVMVSARAVQAAGEAGTLRLQVDDTGIGIPAAMLAGIFEPFSQADSTATREYGGTGLGLAITQRLVELIGGQCGVESEFGVGSSFWCSLALPGVPGATPAPAAGPGLLGARALVVDDSPASRLALEGYLLGWGMDVTMADSGSAAIDAAILGVAEGRPFSVALVDADMPAMNGRDLAAALAAGPATSHMAVVLLATSEGPLGALPPGTRAQLTKPVRREPLRRCLTDLVVAGRADRGSSPAERARGGSGQILLAEDNLINQKVTVAMLNNGGYRVDVVANGLEAVTAAEGHRYDLVLMDCHMPKMDGLQATAAIRTGEGGRRRTPIVALTAAGQQEDKDRCLAAGMDDHLAKPVDKDHLLATVVRWAGHASPAFLSADQSDPSDTT